MESEIEPEYECQICMDLLVEPSTTVCGHTFCKICLIKYLKTKLNCPMCRKPILQSKDSISKNVIMENIIKAKYSLKYEERLKMAKLMYEEEAGSVDDKLRNNLPAVVIRGANVWPKVRKRIKVTEMQYEPTISISSINDRVLCVIPENIPESNLRSNEGSHSLNQIACLVELVNIQRAENSSELNVELLGLKRFKVRSFRSATFDQGRNTNTNSLIFICSGEIIKDMEIDSPDLLASVANKLHDIDLMHTQILQNGSQTFERQLENTYGKKPSLPGSSNNTVSQLEPISLYFLNLIKSEDKKRFYESSNIIERVDFIYDKFTQAYSHIGNQSLPVNFYDLQIAGLPKNQLKYTIILFLFISIFCLLVKFKIFRKV